MSNVESKTRQQAKQELERLADWLESGPAISREQIDEIIDRINELGKLLYGGPAS
jgi:hypothetical protein